MAIKLLCFDLDGVLVPACEIHYEALNRAISDIAGPQFLINLSEHRERYNGLPTRTKLEMLSLDRGLSRDLHEKIQNRKQIITLELVMESIKPNPELITCLESLVVEGYQLWVCTNSIFYTALAMLQGAGLYDIFRGKVISNQDTFNNKPHPSCWLIAMNNAGVGPRETLIFEDSENGLISAYRSGANVCPINNTEDLTETKIRKFIGVFNEI
jgi:HAD superfamily hydrolase (TIGR01509 family)